jgi:hypothetical protein
MDLNNLENKFFFHLDKFSKTCESDNEEEILKAFEKTVDVWKELKKYNLTDKFRKQYPNCIEIFNKLDEFKEVEILAS